jgi:NADPH:quinone reductase-like Zn-dependent oxidoreductase
MTEEKTIDLDNDALEDVGEVDLVFDVIGGDIGKRSARLIRAGGTLVSIVGPSEARPADGLAVDFVVESDRAQLNESAALLRLPAKSTSRALGGCPRHLATPIGPTW